MHGSLCQAACLSMLCHVVAACFSDQDAAAIVRTTDGRLQHIKVGHQTQSTIPAQCLMSPQHRGMRTVTACATNGIAADHRVAHVHTVFGNINDPDASVSWVMLIKVTLHAACRMVSWYTSQQAYHRTTAP